MQFNFGQWFDKLLGQTILTRWVKAHPVYAPFASITHNQDCPTFFPKSNLKIIQWNQYKAYWPDSCHRGWGLENTISWTLFYFITSKGKVVNHISGIIMFMGPIEFQCTAFQLINLRLWLRNFKCNGIGLYRNFQCFPTHLINPRHWLRNFKYTGIGPYRNFHCFPTHLINPRHWLRNFKYN